MSFNVLCQLQLSIATILGLPLSANPVFHSHIKHVVIDFHFVREQVANRRLKVTHVHSSDQFTDSLTKPLARAPFLSHRTKIGILAGSSILQGHNK